MSKTIATTTLAPAQFAAGVEVIEDDARAVLEVLNWVAACRPNIHLAMGCGLSSYGRYDGSQDVSFQSTVGWYEVFRIPVVLCPEVQALEVGARCYVSGTDQAQVRVTVGAAAAVTLTTYTNATNGTEHKTSVATTSSGTGEIEVVVEINHAVGSATDCYLRDLRISESEIAAADLPDPEAEPVYVTVDGSPVYVGGSRVTAGEY